tara:strand:+ start:143 stop:1795 length:1653 start_codon:yes stop_codon:yes gene_type:complete
MIHFHYNQDTIQAQHPSEAKFHRNFLLPLRDSELLGEEVHVYHSYFLGDHSNQLEGEIDFLIVCAFGVVVVEVKGGLIDYNNNNFYQTNRRTKKTEVIHPVKQVRANKASIRHLINKGLLNFSPIVIHAIVFPDCAFNEHEIQLNTEDLFSAKNSPLNFEKKIKQLFSSTKYHLEKKERLQLQGKINSLQLEKLRTILVPNIQAYQAKFNHLLEAKNQNVLRNIRILRGLLNNRRLMIETPFAGSKSFYVVDNIVQKLKTFHFKDVVYICWNKFLSQKMRLLFNERDLAHIKVYEYHRFVEILAKKNVEYDSIQDVIQNELVTAEVLPRFDYIIVDEAQELFHQGLYDLLNSICIQKSGIQNGRWTVFYDQAINPKALNTFPSNEYREFLENSCYYKLDHEYRLIAHKGITKYINNLKQGKIKKMEGYSNLHYYPYFGLDNLKSKIETHLINENLNLNETILLTTSRFKQSYPDFEWNFKNFKSKELIQITQQEENPKVLFYTTALAYRGLISKNVYIVTHKINEEDTSQIYQLMVAASRSVGSLIVMEN